MLPAVLYVLMAMVLGPAPVVQAAEGRQETLSVAATIKPVHSLLAALMRGVGSPTLLFADARSIMTGRAVPDFRQASYRLVFRIGVSQEDAALKRLPGLATTKMVGLMNAPGVRLMDIRRGHRNVGAPRVRAKQSDRRSASRQRRIERDGIVFRTRDGRKVLKPGARRNGQVARPTARRRAKAHKTVVAQPDPFIWLDPRNAIAMARHMAGVLIQHDPDNARKYKRNLAALIVTLETLDADITGLLRPVRTNKFAVLNNRLQYFEEQYLLRPAIELNLDLALMTLDKAQKVGKQLQGGSMHCILAPARATPAQFRAMQPGGKRRVVAIDPYGAEFDSGPDMYENMMRAMGLAYSRCLARSGPAAGNSGGRNGAGGKK